MNLFSRLTETVRPPETFETGRLLARPPRPEDAAAALAVYAGDPVATRYLAWTPYTAPEPLAEFFRARAEGWEKSGGEYPHLLFRRDSGELIGSISTIIEGPKAMFGYVLGQAHWGRGYASEALTFLVAWADAESGLNRAWACCAVENAASARVMEKAGLECEGVLHRWQVFPNLGPTPRDCLFYAKVK